MLADKQPEIFANITVKHIAAVGEYDFRKKIRTILGPTITNLRSFQLRGHLLLWCCNPPAIA